MAEHGNCAGKALENLASLADGKPKYVRLVTADFPAECRCGAVPGRECSAAVTQEDLLCDTCRGGCYAVNIGGEWLDRHQPAPFLALEHVNVRDWGNARNVTWAGPLDSPNARIALGGDDECDV